ncbi:hypothetical protein CPSG_07743 [Coccidioides posadasii str. Silveira]|uniref:Uncharacterized protein n=1 Tax=Coccidioides posadasii (strain RMSCC 757 / Silveira) TaxID=443226 RepID=E9DDV2_COCPS|nr:hypothetical protein CPSG_07743 [Coccidioides posadasii str. Silveira]
MTTRRRGEGTSHIKGFDSLQETTRPSPNVPINAVHRFLPKNVVLSQLRSSVLVAYTLKGKREDVFKEKKKKKYQRVTGASRLSLCTRRDETSTWTSLKIPTCDSLALLIDPVVFFFERIAAL